MADIFMHCFTTDVNVCHVCVQKEGKGQLQQCHENVEEVQVIIQDSMNKIQEREYSLEELDERGEALRKAVTMTFLNVHTKTLFCSIRRYDFVC